jgi:hypothetical protein
MKSKASSNKIFTSLHKGTKSISGGTQVFSTNEKKLNTTIKADEDGKKSRSNMSKSKEKINANMKCVKDTRTSSFDLGNSMLLSKSYYIHTQSTKENKAPESIEKKQINDSYILRRDINNPEEMGTRSKFMPNPGNRESSPMKINKEYRPSTTTLTNKDYSDSTFAKYLSNLAVKKDNLKSKENTVNSSSFIFNCIGNNKPVITSQILQINKDKIINKLTSKSPVPNNNTMIRNPSATSSMKTIERHSISSNSLVVSREKLLCEEVNSPHSEIDSKLNVFIVLF